jgi:hypothetical protein
VGKKGVGAERSTVVLSAEIRVSLSLFFIFIFLTSFAQFNVLWLDPTNPDAFPDGLVDAMVETAAAATAAAAVAGGSQRSMEEQLRAQMRADALQPLGDDEDLPPKNADASGSRASLPPRTIEDAAQFLQLDVSTHTSTFSPASSFCSAQYRTSLSFFLFFVFVLLLSLANSLRDKPVERLDRVLRYLRAEYHYCFWCGTQYKSSDEMQAECPGPDEDMHD